MARRTIQECDLTKAEYDPDLTVTITIKKPGKGRGRSYDLSPEAAAKLEQQLVSNHELHPHWSFGYASPDTEPKEPRSTSSGETDDDKMVAKKKAQLEEMGVDIKEVTIPKTTSEQKGCTHINKTAISFARKDGNPFAYRTCKECDLILPEKTAKGKKSYLSQALPEGVNLGDYDK